MSGGPHRKDACPDCGKPKRIDAARCRPCYVLTMEGTNQGGGHAKGDYSPNAIHTISRRESIISFTRDNVTRTLHCFGDDRASQMEHGLRRLPGEDWEVGCVSTPASILRDLKRSA